MKNLMMKDFVKDYLSYQRKLGYQLRSQGVLLENFAKFADQRRHSGPLTTDFMVDWATGGNASPKYNGVRLQAVSRFAKYRAIYDPQTQIPPRGILGRIQKRSHVVVYNDDQMEKLICKIRQHKTLNNFTKETYEALLGLLLCTGLRISEALHLLDSEVDLEEGILRVVQTKFSKSRLVPLHPTAKRALLEYKRRRDEKFPRRFANAFFVGDKGGPLMYGCLQSKFWKFKKDSGLQKDLMATNPFHCFRHTFAMRRLIKWHRENKDTEKLIAALSTYMGHVKVSDTYWYFSAIPELMEIVSKRFEMLSLFNAGRDLK